MRHRASRGSKPCRRQPFGVARRKRRTTPAAAAMPPTTKPTVESVANVDTSLNAPRSDAGHAVPPHAARRSFFFAIATPPQTPPKIKPAPATPRATPAGHKTRTVRAGAGCVAIERVGTVTFTLRSRSNVSETSFDAASPTITLDCAGLNPGALASIACLPGSIGRSTPIDADDTGWPSIFNTMSPEGPLTSTRSLPMCGIAVSRTSFARVCAATNAVGAPSASRSCATRRKFSLPST